VDSLTKVTGLVARILLLIGASILSVMMFLTMADVVLRYVFGSPVSGAYEMTQYMMAIVIPFGIVYCAHEKGHVSVDVLFDLLPKRIQGVFSCITSLIVIVLFILIAWQNVLFVHETYESGLTSAVLYIPSYPFVGTIALGFVVLCLVLLADFLNILLETVSK
jgi:TRAP-type C4-dicarboxylate transport system permease small subunit